MSAKPAVPFLLAILAAPLASATALAQTTVTAPAWGQYTTPAWGAYSSAVGQGGWSFNRQLKPVEPSGSVLLDPNQASSNFANPRTGASLFQPQDTRLRGRDRP